MTTSRKNAQRDFPSGDEELLREKPGVLWRLCSGSPLRQEAGHIRHFRKHSARLPGRTSSRPQFLSSEQRLAQAECCGEHFGGRKEFCSGSETALLQDLTVIAEVNHEVCEFTFSWLGPFLEKQRMKPGQLGRGDGRKGGKRDVRRRTWQAWVQRRES